MKKRFQGTPSGGRRPAGNTAKAKTSAEKPTKAAEILRNVLPIPDIQPINLTTYDAKYPDTKYPPIVPLRPPKGAPND